jgi:hypothetical protein
MDGQANGICERLTDTGAVNLTAADFTPKEHESLASAFSAAKEISKTTDPSSEPAPH